MRMLRFLFGNVCVQVIPQKISAIHAAVPIEYSKIGRFLPLSYHLLWFREVQDDCHSIFIVLPHWALIGRGGVGSDGSVPVLGVFCRFEIRDGD